MNNSRINKLLDILQYAFNNSPAVKSIFEEASLLPDQIQTLSDLDKIPVTSKDKLAELQQAHPPFGGFLAIPPEELEHIFLSPGPLYEPYTSTSSTIDSIREMLELSGFGPGDVVLNTFGYHLIPTGLVLDQVLRELGATIIPAGVGNADLQIKMMLELGVSGYIGTPSWLMALIQKAEELGLNLPDDLALRKVLVSAEPMPSGMRQTMEEKLDAIIVNAYGTAELGFLAFNKGEGMAMRLLESSIIQVVNPETGKSVGSGEVGEVVVTTFNPVYPLIRLGTGDLAMNMDPAPGQSRQGERSIILVGRIGDAVKVRGMFVHPNQLQFAIAQVPGISRYQAVISHMENRDQFTLQIVTDKSIDSETITKSLSAAIQSSCRVKVDNFEFVAEETLNESEALILDTRAWD